METADGKRAWELETLLEISLAFNKNAELQDAFSSTLALLNLKAGFSCCMAALRNEKGLLAIVEAEGLSAAEKEQGVYRLGEGLAGRVFETGLPITVNDLSKDGRFINRAKTRNSEELAGKTYYCVPILQGSSTAGTLSAERRVSTEDAERSRAADRAFLVRAAEIIACAVSLREKIKKALNEAVQVSLEEKSSDAALSYNENTVFLGEGSRIIGASSAMRDLYAGIKQVAPTDATVLIQGQSGTGKELIAAEIQRLSRRAAAPFVKLNCAALPESIIESELFGHEKGAFTGALNKRIGRFESAHLGTLFFDEIGELPPQIQVKILRVLQEKEIERIGGTGTLKVDVRLIAATNKNLEEEVKKGRFREDLFYRLNVFPLAAPPLHERKGDIMLLADYFTAKYAKKNEKLIKRISSPAIDLLTSYHWPGNVRELENCIERAVILASDMVIHSYHLPPSLQSAVSTGTEPASTLEPALSRVEKEMIIEALKITGGNIVKAAARLGITERQLGLRIKHYGINWRFYRG